MTSAHEQAAQRRGPSVVLSVVAAFAALLALHAWQPPPAAAGPTSTPSAAPSEAAGPTAVDDVVDLQASTVTGYVLLAYAKNDVPGGAALVRKLTTFSDDQPAGTTVSDDHATAYTRFGHLWLNAAGTMQIVVAPQQSGTAVVRYRLVDANGAADEALITVVVGPGGRYATLDLVEGHEATSDVLAGDIPSRNADGTPGSIDTTSVRFTTSSGGPSATVSADGRTLADPGRGVFRADPTTGVVTFDPEKTYRGGYEEQVSYVAQDTTLAGDGTVQHHPYRLPIFIFVHVIDPKPVDDEGRTPFQASLILPGLTDDLAGDPSVPLSVRLTTFVPPSVPYLPSGSTLSTDGHDLSVPGQGSWTIDATGTITFSPARGFSGWPTSVDYFLRDVNGATTEGDEQVWVAPGPRAKPDVATTTQNVDVRVVATDNDVPGHDADNTPGSIDRTAVHFPATPQPVGATVTASGRILTVPGEGVYTADRIEGVITFDPEPQLVGTASPVRYSVQDTVTRTDGRVVHNLVTSTVTVAVRAIAPVLLNNWSNTTVGRAVEVPVLGNDRPGAASAPLVASSVRLRLGPGLPRSSTLSADGRTLTIPGRGAYVARTDGVVVVTPAQGFAGIVPTVGYTVGDTNGTIASATVTVGVHGASS
ncbi:MAG: Ig-like domain-containing protein [Janthinobacterium lividum]